MHHVTSTIAVVMGFIQQHCYSRLSTAAKPGIFKPARNLNYIQFTSLLQVLDEHTDVPHNYNG
jgi:hypothetical protein